MNFRFTKKEINGYTDTEILRILVIERQSELKPDSLLSDRLLKIYCNLEEKTKRETKIAKSEKDKIGTFITLELAEGAENVVIAAKKDGSPKICYSLKGAVELTDKLKEPMIVQIG